MTTSGTELSGDSVSSAHGRASFKLVQAALTRCLAANPPTMPGRELCPDAEHLSEVYAVMTVQSEIARDLAGLTLDQREAYLRWVPDNGL